jgi:hypothetical protein
MYDNNVMIIIMARHTRNLCLPASITFAKGPAGTLRLVFLGQLLTQQAVTLFYLDMSSELVFLDAMMVSGSS